MPSEPEGLLEPGTGPRAEEGANGREETHTDHDVVIAGIPAYNEEISIGSVILAASRFVDEVIVVDDGSTDETRKIASQAGATVISHEENQGKGATIRTLMRYLETREFDAVVLLDGDGQHIPDDIPQVTEPVLDAEADLVIGSRTMDDANENDIPAYRWFGQRVLDIATSTSTGTALYDSQSGFRALSPETVGVLSTESDGYSIESEMIDDASQNGLKITEAPIDVRYDGVDGQTVHPVVHGLEVMGFVARLVRSRHPLVYFGVPGATLLIGGVVSTWMTDHDGDRSDRLRIFAGTLSASVGLLLLTVGYVLNGIFGKFKTQSEPEP